MPNGMIKYYYHFLISKKLLKKKHVRQKNSEFKKLFRTRALA